MASPNGQSVIGASNPSQLSWDYFYQIERTYPEGKLYAIFNNLVHGHFPGSGCLHEILYSMCRHYQIDACSYLYSSLHTALVPILHSPYMWMN